MVLTTVKAQESSGLATAMVNEETKLSSTFSASYRDVTNTAFESDVESDVIVQLKANLTQLEDMHARLRFMMGELSYLLKRD